MSSATAPVSVVIPCWRCSATIRRAIDSIVGQSVLPAEVILVDDASGDDTLATLRQLADRFPSGWIRVVGLAKNGGPGAARNAGWDLASQEWIAFLDADDAWHPRKIEMQLAWLQAHPDTALCGHGTELSTGTNSYPNVPNRPTGRRVSFNQMLISNRFPTRSVMLRRDLPFRFGDRTVTEDYLLWLEIILAGYAAYHIHAPLSFSFRADYSPGGYSGQLWRHEQRELEAWRLLHCKGKINFLVRGIATIWSITKFIRRVINVNRG
jgi:glycosyltransferase involved in cell wall biosynthesis